MSYFYIKILGAKIFIVFSLFIFSCVYSEYNTLDSISKKSIFTWKVAKILKYTDSFQKVGKENLFKKESVLEKNFPYQIISIIPIKNKLLINSLYVLPEMLGEIYGKLFIFKNNTNFKVIATSYGGPLNIKIDINDFNKFYIISTHKIMVGYLGKRYVKLSPFTKIPTLDKEYIKVFSLDKKYIYLATKFTKNNKDFFKIVVLDTFKNQKFLKIFNTPSFFYGISNFLNLPNYIVITLSNSKGFLLINKKTKKIREIYYPNGIFLNLYKTSKYVEGFGFKDENDSYFSLIHIRYDLNLNPIYKRILVKKIPKDKLSYPNSIFIIPYKNNYIIFIRKYILFYAPEQNLVRWIYKRFYEYPVAIGDFDDDQHLEILLSNFTFLKLSSGNVKDLEIKSCLDLYSHCEILNISDLNGNKKIELDVVCSNQSFFDRKDKLLIFESRKPYKNILWINPGFSSANPFDSFNNPWNPADLALSTYTVNLLK